MSTVRVRVPATSANLGPGFDCLGLALDLWNEVTFSAEGDAIRLQIEGEGSDKLPADRGNLVARAALHAFTAAGERPSTGLRIHATNRVPLGSGLGSSAAAALAGLLGANALLGGPLSEADILRLGNDLEGHPDNLAAALLGGLTVAARGENGLIARRVEAAALSVVAVVPEIHLPTSAARKALPTQVPLAEAVFNLGHSALVVEALRTGDLELLGQAMEDRLHEAYRLALIPGAEAALEAARQAGAAAAAISGAGPGLVAFTDGKEGEIASAMEAAFQALGVKSRRFMLAVAQEGAEIIQE